MEASKKDLTIEDVRSILGSFSKVIYDSIPHRFRNNSIIEKYIYISAALTLIRLFSINLSKRNPIFNKDYDVVVYKLDQDFVSIVKLVVNKSLLVLADEIKDTIDKFKVGDVEYDILMNSVFGGSDRNEEFYTLD